MHHPESRDQELDRRESRGQWWVLRLLTVLLVAGAAATTWSTFTYVPYEAPVTDFGRDLIGAQAVDYGQSPYQTLGEIQNRLGLDSVSDDAVNYWVAHTPFSIGVARAWLWAFGENSESIFRVLTLVAMATLIVTLGWWIGSRDGWWRGVAIASSAVMLFSLPHDIAWLHGGAIAGALLAPVLIVDRSRLRPVGLIALGVLVAWKPWLAPVAFLLPGRHSSIRDALRVSVVALSLNLVALATIGGLDALVDWVVAALPGNFDDREFWSWNLSVVGRHLNSRISAIVFAVTTGLGIALTRWVPRPQWPLIAVVVIALASPLVWPQYWLTLVPLTVVGYRSSSFLQLLVVLLLLSSGFVNTMPLPREAIVGLAVLAIALEVTHASISSPQNRLHMQNRKLRIPIA